MGIIITFGDVGLWFWGKAVVVQRIITIKPDKIVLFIFRYILMEHSWQLDILPQFSLKLSKNHPGFLSQRIAGSKVG